jgi:glycosyltransferase involved in cell wall biosynthesis
MDNPNIDVRKLSVTIITKNEADRIERCILSIRDLADDIVVIDSGSTDGTQELCQSLGARIVFNQWTGFGPQKRFAENSAYYDWILNLDADEWLTKEAAEEIKALLRQPGEILPFWKIKLLNILPHEKRPRWLADYHNYIRLYDKKVGGFPDDLVHDEVKAPSSITGQLNASAWHRSIRSLSHMAAKQIDYYTLQAKQFNRSSWSLVLRVPFEFPISFFRYYVSKRFFSAGTYGFVMSMALAGLRIVRLAILFEASLKKKG